MSSIEFSVALKTAESGSVKLANLISDTGKFKYRYNSRNNKELSGYNVLRHCGTVWSMLDVFLETNNEYVLNSAKNAVTFLFNNHIKFYKNYSDICVSENNEIKLGGNGLAVLALSELYKIEKNDILIETAHKISKFIIKEKENKGDFIHKRCFNTGNIYSFKSEYYVGEALLSLLACYEITKDTRLLNFVVEVERKLYKQNYGVKEQSHWMLYALQKLQKFYPASFVYNHAEKIAKEIIEKPLYLDWKRSTPIACRNEGLIAFANMDCPENLDTSFQTNVLKTITENLNNQLKFKTNDGAFIRGGKDRRNDEVRIDYIQHNISSFLHFYQLPLIKTGKNTKRT